MFSSNRNLNEFMMVIYKFLIMECSIHALRYSKANNKVASFSNQWINRKILFIKIKKRRNKPRMYLNVTSQVIIKILNIFLCKIVIIALLRKITAKTIIHMYFSNILSITRAISLKKKNLNYTWKILGILIKITHS